MFWKRVRRIVDGLKFKAVIGFGALLAASAALCWFSTARLFDRSMRKELDRRLDSELEQMNRAYVTGQERTQIGRHVPISAVSELELELIRKKFPDGRLLYVFERDSRHERFRFFYISVEDDIFQARINSDGSVYSRLQSGRERIGAVKIDFASRVRGEGDRRLRLRLRAPGGELLAAAPPDPNRKDSDAGFAVKSLTLFDGNRLEAARSTEEIEALRQELQRLQGAVFIALLCIVVPCGWFLVHRLLSGIGKVSAAAQRIATGGDLNCQVSCAGGGAEIRELVNAFNTMNRHNHKLFNEVRSVTDNVAHELKTPLTRLRGSAEVALVGNRVSRETGELAAVVSEECSEMLALINSMLEITRTESGLLAPIREPVDLTETLRRAGELFAPLAEDMKIDLVMELPDDPVLVPADRMKLQRVFANLIDNALKFSDPGGKVSIRASRGDDTVSISVSDTGCGIGESDLPHIFERLYRCDSSRSRPGSGLGLTLAAAIVHAHDGEIKVQSAPGRGSVFTVTLPRNPGE